MATARKVRLWTIGTGFLVYASAPVQVQARRAPAGLSDVRAMPGLIAPDRTPSHQVKRAGETKQAKRVVSS